MWASIEVDHIGDLESSLRDGVLCVIRPWVITHGYIDASLRDGAVI